MLSTFYWYQTLESTEASGPPFCGVKDTARQSTASRSIKNGSADIFLYIPTWDFFAKEVWFHRWEESTGVWQMRTDKNFQKRYTNDKTVSEVFTLKIKELYIHALFWVILAEKPPSRKIYYSSMLLILRWLL